MAKNSQYHLHLKGFVGGYDFDADYVDYILSQNKEKEVNVLIDSLGGRSSTALSIFSAFKRHGNVNVHFVGMNASAATIASLGAKRITMDSSAMYLVHKCSIGFFEWGNMNADDLQTLITNIEHQKKDLDKLDANIAQMYATRCKKESSQLLELMKDGGWLTAKEALAWGFVDELTEYDDEDAPVLNDYTMQALATAGIPIPNLPKTTDDQSAFARFLNALASMFKTNIPDNKQTPITTMKKVYASICAILACEALESAEGKTTLEDAQLESIETNISSLKNEIATLKTEKVNLETEKKSLQDANSQLTNEITELKKKPAETSAHVVDDKQPETEKTSVERYFESRANAKSLFDAIP